MNMREQFEARFPAPTGVEWDEANQCYKCKVPSPYLALWMGWTAARDTTCPGHGRSECVSCCWPKGQEPEPVQNCEIGIYGRAYDRPGVTRAYTYRHLPDNVGASKLGQACYHAIQKPGGDSIDLGLELLKHLQDAGFGVFEVKS